MGPVGGMRPNLGEIQGWELSSGQRDAHEQEPLNTR